MSLVFLLEFYTSMKAIASRFFKMPAGIAKLSLRQCLFLPFYYGAECQGHTLVFSFCCFKKLFLKKKKKKTSQTVKKKKQSNFDNDGNLSGVY